MEHWFEVVPSGGELSQGEIALSFPVVTVYYEAKTIKATSGHADVIVLTQSCDIEQNKVENIILGRVLDIEEYRKQWTDNQISSGQTPTDKSWTRELERIGDGARPQYALLNGCEIPDGPTVPRRLVVFSTVYTVPLAASREFVNSPTNGDRVRLISPYREYLSQRFAWYLMRPALPSPVSRR